MTNLQGYLELSGYQNPQCKIQDVVDAATRVSVLRDSNIAESGSNLRFGVTLAVLHDAPLLVVIDLAHGPTENFEIPVAKGATAANANFNFEIIDFYPGLVYQGSWGWPKPETVELQYGKPIETTKSFSVIHHTNPPMMAASVSVDALDTTGNEIKNSGTYMEHAPATSFGMPLANASKLRVRYRPHLTRLLLRLDHIPGVSPPNSAPSNLFDVHAPRIIFRDAVAMRRFISDTTQLKDISGTISCHPEPAFPMTLENPSPREVVAHYLKLDPNRKIMVDPAAQTIAFEQPKKKSRINGAIDWLRMRPWWP